MDSNIDFDLYKMFYNVVKAGTFSRAAEELYISQSAVTQAIQKLEDQIGGTLFVRSRKGVSLTDAGRVLYEYLAPSLETLQNAEDVFSKYQNMEIGTIRMVAGSTLSKIALKESLVRFSKDYPNIHISLENKRTSDAIGMLVTGKIDLVLLNIASNVEYDNIKIIELYETEDIFFVNKAYYQKIKKNKITLQHLKDYRLVLPAKGTNSRILIDEKVEKQGEKIEANYSFSSSRQLADFVKQVDVIGYTSRLAITEELEKGELIRLDVGLKDTVRKIGLACLDKKIVNNATLKLIDYIVEEAKNKLE